MNTQPLERKTSPDDILLAAWQSKDMEAAKQLYLRHAAWTKNLRDERFLSITHT